MHHMIYVLKNSSSVWKNTHQIVKTDYLWKMERQVSVIGAMGREFHCFCCMSGFIFFLIFKKYEKFKNTIWAVRGRNIGELVTTASPWNSLRGHTQDPQVEMAGCNRRKGVWLGGDNQGQHRQKQRVPLLMHMVFPL